tara:strand:- start:362 stop:688 length:327 start_codon:yes stop_codon:yes gene_type:complete
MALKTLEEFTTETQAEVDAIKTANGGDGFFNASSTGRTEFSDDDYASYVTRVSADKLDEQNNGYKIARKAAYESIPNQLDMQYWDEVNSTTTWKDHIAKVKSDNPKPE